MITKTKAFTLAETLISLGIIGVVAAVTMPILIQKYQERVFVNRLKTTYSIMGQSFTHAVADLGPMIEWGIVSSNATKEEGNKVADILSKYMKSEKCKNSMNCFADNYKTLDGGSYTYNPKQHPLYADARRLANGVTFTLAASSSGTSAKAIIYVDLNGAKRPNQAGVDYFAFVMIDSKIYPMGKKGTNMANGYICNKNTHTEGNGIGCSAWVITNGNMDYLRRDITEEWPLYQQ